MTLEDMIDLAESIPGVSGLDVDDTRDVPHITFHVRETTDPNTLKTLGKILSWLPREEGT